MIGMMYLVLTALLALNVSNAVLEKFAIIDDTLQQLRSETELNNANINQRIQDATTARAADAKKRATEVRALTIRTLAEMDGVIAQLKKNKDGEEIPMDELILDTNNAEEKMLDPREGVGLGKGFENILTRYHDSVQIISRITGLPKLNRKVDEYKIFDEAKELKEHHKDKDFIHFTFEGTPTMASIAVIRQMQTELLETEATVLDSLARIADVGTLKVDQYAVMVIPESNIVVAGARYKAKMFVAASSSGLTPSMKRNGAELAVAQDTETGLKMANIEFTAGATNYGPDGTVEQSYMAEIKLPNPDTTLTRSIKYRVAQPVIKATSGRAPTLYRNCANPVTIDVPSLGANYNPTFTPRGASVVLTSEKSRPIVTPTDSRISIAVSSGGNAIGSVEFETKPIPRPRYSFKNALGRGVTISGEPVSGLGAFSVVANPEENFQKELPTEATYIVNTFEISWWRGTTQMGGKAKQGVNGAVNLGDWRPQLKPGDTFEVKLLKVSRKRGNGSFEDVSLAGEVPYVIKLK